MGREGKWGGTLCRRPFGTETPPRRHLSEVNIPAFLSIAPTLTGTICSLTPVYLPLSVTAASRVAPHRDA